MHFQVEERARRPGMVDRGLGPSATDSLYLLPTSDCFATSGTTYLRHTEGARTVVRPTGAHLDVPGPSHCDFSTWEWKVVYQARAPGRPVPEGAFMYIFEYLFPSGQWLARFRSASPQRVPSEPCHSFLFEHRLHSGRTLSADVVSTLEKRRVQVPGRVAAAHVEM